MPSKELGQIVTNLPHGFLDDQPLCKVYSSRAVAPRSAFSNPVSSEHHQISPNGSCPRDQKSGMEMVQNTVERAKFLPKKGEKSGTCSRGRRLSFDCRVARYPTLCTHKSGHPGVEDAALRSSVTRLLQTNVPCRVEGGDFLTATHTLHIWHTTCRRCSVWNRMVECRFEHEGRGGTSTCSRKYFFPNKRDPL